MYVTPIRMATMEKKIISVGKDMEKLEHLCISYKMVQLLWTITQQFLKIKHRITMLSSNPTSAYIYIYIYTHTKESIYIYICTHTKESRLK